MREDHRVYSFLSEPVRLLGLTIDEIILGITAFGIFVLVDRLYFQLGAVVGGIFGVWFIKKMKRSSHGFSLKSYIHWTFGVRFNLDPNWPKSAYKRWLS